ncbi:MAG TPA: ATP-binding protein [Bryobacteraceae bacterium]|nr:ATP-binding protein [Bryobacteraceae bacterium]
MAEFRWLNIISDSLITISFFSIPFTLSYYSRKRSGSKLRVAIPMCAILMTACGATHLLLVWNMWHSSYRLESVVKAIAAAVTVAAAIGAFRLAPMVLKIATPKELAFLYDSLSGETEARRAAEEKLRHIAEAELLVSEDKLRSFFDGASQSILGVSKEGRILFVNRRAEEMFGYSRAELLGEEIEKLVPGTFSRTLLRGAAPAAGPGIELAGWRKDGIGFPIEVGLSYVSTPEGPLAFAMVNDISERVKSAFELKRVNDELRQSYTELEQFAHVASHDLQEPLRMVTSYLQLIERRYNGRLDDDGREFIHFAVDGTKRMRALIKDLLDFSRTGTDATHREAVAAGSLVENALSNLKTAIHESGAQITADALPTIVVDPVLFTQVFQNLIANAIKFQKGTAPKVHISVQAQAREWIFSVQDNGIGIEPQHRDRIFRIFERLHAVDQYSGSGIGLAITRKIVERHGGRIWVESQPGTGSTFRFSTSAEMEIANAANCGSSP